MKDVLMKLPDQDSIENNKSPLTHAITSGVQTYLKDKGFKPIETEVPIEEGWVADVASVIVPTPTELQIMKLIPKRPSYTVVTQQPQDPEWWKSDAYKKLLNEQDKKFADWKAKINAIPCPLTAVVEVKTTRSDWMTDTKWNRISPVNLRYLAIPAGLLKRTEFPVDWFVLEFNAEGRCLRVAQQGNITDVSAEKRMWVIHEIALKRHHRTEHVWQRSVMKRFAAGQTASKQNYRVGNVAKALLDVLNGGGTYNKSVEECFRFYGIDFNRLPHFVREEVKALWGIKSAKQI